MPVTSRGSPNPFPLLGAAILLAAFSGCAGQNPQTPLHPPTPQRMAQFRQPPAPTKLTPDEIGKNAFGSSLRSVRRQGGTVQFEFAPKPLVDPAANFRRIYLLSSLAAPATFSTQKGVNQVRFTAVDAQRPQRRLVVFSLSRKDSSQIDWQHGLTYQVISGRARTEYVDPEYQPLAPAAEGGRRIRKS